MPRWGKGLSPPLTCRGFKQVGPSGPVDPLLLPLVGAMVFAVAFLYSNLGLGGGLLYVPILLTFAISGEDAQRIAVPVSLTYTIATALSATINHHLQGLVDWRLGLRLVAGAMGGAVLGSHFTLTAARWVFDLLFIAITVLFGAQMMRDWMGARTDFESGRSGLDTPSRRSEAAVATAGSGFVSGAVGVGGGLVNVPLMVYLLGRRTREAIGTSNLLIMPTAAMGFVAFFLSPASSPVVREGIVANGMLILALWPVVFVGAYFGSRWGLARLKTRSVGLIFILFLFVAAVRLAVDLVQVLGWV